MNNFETTGRGLPLPKARYEAPEPWKDTEQKQLLQFLKTPSGTKFLLKLHDDRINRLILYNYYDEAVLTREKWGSVFFRFLFSFCMCSFFNDLVVYFKLDYDRD